ncbi:MAG: hypothetical protein HYY48_02395 [Gammaproteobacteria bacterium]|nr:hypothetical protein [Gammaproteobacteria bacterium]
MSAVKGQVMFRKYTIAGESNPVWQLVEPAILKLWATGMLKASYPSLYLVHVMALLVASVTFALSFCFRLLLLAVIFVVAYVAFEDALTQVLATVLALPETGGAPATMPPSSTLWMYQLAGYVVVIAAVVLLLLVLGKHFMEWARDVVFYLLLMITLMVPLKWIARGLLRENYFAQLIAKSSFMGAHIAGTIAAAPPEITRQYDRLIGLYQGSNDEKTRKELEQLCAQV